MEKYVVVGVSILTLMVCASALAAAQSTSLYTRICTETDDGMDYIHSGVTTDYSGSHADSCVDSTHVMEWYCYKGYVQSHVHECPNGCADGACIQQNPNTVIYHYACVNQPDGILYGPSGVFGEERLNHCINNKRLILWRCIDNVPDSKEIECKLGCVDGACSKVPVVWATSSTVTSTTSSTTTSTSITTTTSTTLVTFSFTEASTSTSSTLLPPDVSCFDSDGGRNFDTSGVVTTTHSILPDECIGWHRIQEWYCSLGKAHSAYAKCPYKCQEGACITPSST